MLASELVPMKQAVNLAHALCQAIADAAGVRVLFLKGPVAAAQGLRPSSHVSSDVDVLCLPGDRAAMESGLRARGWRLRPVSTAAREFTTHSITFIHDTWPCDIDLHTAFPGLLATPETSFEALWSRREEHRLAGVTALTPDRVAQFLILLLHGLRSPDLARNSIEIARARSMYRNDLTSTERSELLDLVARTEAAEPTEEFFRSVGEQVTVPPKPSPGYVLWKLKTAPSRTESWLMYALALRGRRRLRVLFRAVVPTAADMYADHPESANGRRELIAAHLHRLLRAARLTPRAMATVLRARHSLHSAVAEPSPIAPARAQPRAAKKTAHADATDVTPRTTPTPRAIAPHALEWSDDKAVLFVLPLTTATSTLLALRDSAAQLWMLMETSGPSPARLSEVASALFETPAADIRPDVETFIRQLVEIGALVAA